LQRNIEQKLLTVTMSCADSLQEYEYDTLPQDDPRGHFVRYLTLHAGSREEPLRCTLHTAPLVETEFEAVSYVWGSDVRDQTIICDGRKLALTTNLFRVLQRVRDKDASRSIWADLICIHQKDLDEKGHQVAIMGQIYRHATRVLIHMGDEDKGHGTRVTSLVQNVCDTIDSVLTMIPVEWNTFPYPNQDDPILSDARWESLRLLLDEIWFTRGWVVREAGFAQAGQVYWGDSEFSWDSLMRTCHWLYKRAAKTLYAKKLDHRIPLTHMEVFEDRYAKYAKLFTTQSTWAHASLLGYLSLTKELNLKDPRDRIYAFMELVQNEARPIRLQPNYKDNYLHVYQQFASEYIRTTEYIGLLSSVEHNEQSLLSVIPTWVPRWDLRLTRSGYGFAPADSNYSPLTSRAGTLSVPTVTDDTTLKSSGVIIDTVLYASDALDRGTTSADTISQIWKEMERLAPSSPYSGMNQLVVFLSILTAGTREGDPHDWLQSMTAYYLKIFQDIGSPADLGPPEWLGNAGPMELFHDTLKNYTHNRKLVLTKRGYMGLAPVVAKKGDACGILFGCNTPCILRASSKSNHYQYLGAAYVVGRDHWETEEGRVVFTEILGSEHSKDWADWDVEEQDILLC
jgi:hypothetical protein